MAFDAICLRATLFELRPALTGAGNANGKAQRKIEALSVFVTI